MSRTGMVGDVLNGACGKGLFLGKLGPLVLAPVLVVHRLAVVCGGRDRRILRRLGRWLDLQLEHSQRPSTVHSAPLPSTGATKPRASPRAPRARRTNSWLSPLLRSSFYACCPPTAAPARVCVFRKARTRTHTGPLCARLCARWGPSGRAGCPRLGGVPPAALTLIVHNGAARAVEGVSRCRPRNECGVIKG